MTAPTYDPPALPTDAARKRLNRLQRPRSASPGPLTDTILAEYQEMLRQIPPPGGNGFNDYLFKLMKKGRRAGLSEDTLISDARAHTPSGSRPPKAREYTHTARNVCQQVEPVGSAAAGHTPGPKAAPEPAPTFTAVIEEYIRQGDGITWERFRQNSPDPIPADVTRQPETLLKALSQLPGIELSDCFFQGFNEGYAAPFQTRHKGTRHIHGMSPFIRTLGEWIEIASCTPEPPLLYPHIIPNPLTGTPVNTGSHDMYRGNQNVKRRHFIVVESDSIPLEKQTAFWGAAPLPLFALIWTAGKSFHAWIYIGDSPDPEKTTEDLYRGILDTARLPDGERYFDAACKSASRLSRMPGYPRADKGYNYSALIWLASKPIVPREVIQ